MQDYTNNSIEIETLPKIATIEFNPMAKHYPLLRSIETLLSWLIIAMIVIVADLLLEKINLSLVAYLIVISLTLLATTHSYFSAKAKGYAVREKDIVYKEGVFWRKITCVSFKRIQHIDITHGPIERKFNIATIKFFTAGGAMADLRISGLVKADAEKLRAFILQITGLTND